MIYLTSAFIHLFAEMEQAHCSKSMFFKKVPLIQFQVNRFQVTNSCSRLERLENFSNPFCLQWVLKMKYCAEMDYIALRVIFFGAAFKF